jgi:hypothetical protein
VSARHPAAVIALGTGVLVAADVAAWLLWVLWHVLPYLLALAVPGALLLALVRHRRPLPPHQAPQVIQGHTEATGSETRPL